MAAKKREIYARIGVQLRSNRRVFKAEKCAPGSFGLYVFCILDTRAELQDGFVPEEVVLGALSRPHDERMSQVDALCSCDLLERVDGGFRVVKYEEHNDTRADVESNRKSARSRQKRKRKTDAVVASVTRDIGVTTQVCHADVPISYSISTSLSGSGSREGESEREPASARYQAAYAAGISRGKCAPWVWPGTKYAEWDLGKIINGHAKDPSGKSYRGDQLLRFIETTAAEFSSDVIARNKSQYYNAFEPKGCLRWLNEGELADEARRVG